MKRILPLLLSVCLLLCGCNAFGGRINEPVTFYYIRNEYQYGNSQENVILGELREASGHRSNVNYLMAMYFLGPISEELHSPLPKDASLLSVTEREETILVEISDTTDTLSDIGFSLAGACLTMTCLEITDAQSITITSGPRTITLTRDNLTLYDSRTVAAAEETK